MIKRLNEIKDQKIVEFAPRFQRAAELATGRQFNFKEKSHAIRSLLNGDLEDVTDEHRDILAHFLYRTRLGRALMYPKPDARHPYEGVLNPLLAGAKAAPKNASFEKLFHVYHGSYKRKKSVAVHLMEVTADEGGLLSVTDYISDQRSATEPVIRNSIGCMTFVSGTVQILTSGEENRIGYSLFIGSAVIDELRKTIHPDGIERPTLIEIVGDLFGTNDKGHNFARLALIRPAMGDRKDLLAATGIFETRDIQSGKVAAVHVDGLRRLKHLNKDRQHEMLDDPMPNMKF